MAQGTPQYLFLYPIEDYFDSMIHAYGSFLMGKYSPRRMDEIISARYRDACYGMNWLMFGLDNDPDEPDMSRVSQYIKIRDEDSVLCAGISFKTQVGQKKYASSKRVLDQLPAHERLVLGGFHCYSCVEKVARVSYRHGVETFVDEDTTDLFFPRTVCCGELPLDRTLTLAEIFKDNPDLLTDVMKQRKKTPWLKGE